ncbi:hypothetical protein G7046_g9430 [Stylonectria norvegica]|nr:hypothetical protein G7046_g9430 [Stylonectria norvegica]
MMPWQYLGWVRAKPCRPPLIAAYRRYTSPRYREARREAVASDSVNFSVMTASVGAVRTSNSNAALGNDTAGFPARIVDMDRIRISKSEHHAQWKALYCSLSPRQAAIPYSPSVPPPCQSHRRATNERTSPPHPRQSSAPPPPKQAQTCTTKDPNYIPAAAETQRSRRRQQTAESQTHGVAQAGNWGRKPSSTPTTTTTSWNTRTHQLRITRARCGDGDARQQQHNK